MRDRQMNRNWNEFEKEVFAEEKASISCKTLDWRDRPPPLKEKITEIWRNLVNESNEEWLYKGSQTYSLCIVDELALIKAIIRDQPDRKEFSI